MATRTKKKNPAKKSVGRVGKTRLSNKSFFQSLMIIPVVVLVALAGYVVVQFSHAYTTRFTKRPGDMYGGTVVYKTVGTKRVKHIYATKGKSVAVRIAYRDAVESVKICASITVKKKATGRIKLVGGRVFGRDSVSSEPMYGGIGSRDVCMTRPGQSTGTGAQHVFVEVDKGTVEVTRIYGQVGR